MKRLTTRSIRTAEAIRDREDFLTSSPNFRGETWDPSRPIYYAGDLSGLDLERFALDNEARVIDYVVWSYSTPIGWHRTDGTWHIVAQTFSVTTSKHQGNLYLAGKRFVRPARMWLGMKNRANQGYAVMLDGEVIGQADTRERADYLRHYIYLNGVPTGTNMNGVTA